MNIKKFQTQTEFEFIELIAEGGMGQVFKARHKGVAGFEKIVAIKTMKSFIAKNSEFRKRFINEAKLVANLVHENIVQIYQLGQLEEMYYFVLEYVNGISLHQFLDHHLTVKKSIPHKLAVFICSRIARGLAYAHSRTDSAGHPLNIVHCDICPDNVLITNEGLTKITDFGIAKMRDSNNNKALTEGKPLFMSPEQARGEILTQQSDIYSLGIVLFLLTSGMLTREFDKEKNQILLYRAGAGDVNWNKLPDDIDPALKQILIKMLAGEPEDRYSSSAELAAALEYHIYKDGYGPTIVTLAEYMQIEMPGLIKKSAHHTTERQTINQTTPIILNEDYRETVVMNPLSTPPQP